MDLAIVNRAEARWQESGGDSHGVGFGFGVVDKLVTNGALEKRNE